jgi:hypothetical protein
MCAWRKVAWTLGIRATRMLCALGVSARSPQSSNMASLVLLGWSDVSENC